MKYISDRVIAMRDEVRRDAGKGRGVGEWERMKRSCVLGEGSMRVCDGGEGRKETDRGR